jgi:hypothetical protein
MGFRFDLYILLGVYISKHGSTDALANESRKTISIVTEFMLGTKQKSQVFETLRPN